MKTYSFDTLTEDHKHFETLEQLAAKMKENQIYWDGFRVCLWRWEDNRPYYLTDAECKRVRELLNG